MGTNFMKFNIFLLLVVISPNLLWAQGRTRSIIEKISVRAYDHDKPDVPGSAHKISKEELKKSKTSDMCKKKMPKGWDQILDLEEPTLIVQRKLH